MNKWRLNVFFPLPPPPPSLVGDLVALQGNRRKSLEAGLSALEKDKMMMQHRSSDYQRKADQEGEKRRNLENEGRRPPGEAWGFICVALCGEPLIEFRGSRSLSSAVFFPLLDSFVLFCKKNNNDLNENIHKTNKIKEITNC